MRRRTPLGYTLPVLLLLALVILTWAPRIVHADLATLTVAPYQTVLLRVDMSEGDILGFNFQVYNSQNYPAPIDFSIIAYPNPNGEMQQALFVPGIENYATTYVANLGDGRYYFDFDNGQWDQSKTVYLSYSLTPAPQVTVLPPSTSTVTLENPSEPFWNNGDQLLAVIIVFVISLYLAFELGKRRPKSA